MRPALAVAARSALATVGLSVIVGVAVGLAWWLLAPGGLQELPGDALSAAEARAGQDVLLAVCCAAAGGLLGLWWLVATALGETSRPAGRGPRALGRLVGLLLGGLAGGALAWATGAATDALAAVAAGVDAAGTEAAAGVAVSGDSGGLGDEVTPAVLAAVLLWPAAVAALVAVDQLRDLIARPEGEEPRAAGLG